MAKHTLKILRCEHRKIFKVCLAILQYMHERVNYVYGIWEGIFPFYNKSYHDQTG